MSYFQLAVTEFAGGFAARGRRFGHGHSQLIDRAGDGGAERWDDVQKCSLFDWGTRTTFYAFLHFFTLFYTFDAHARPNQRLPVHW
jgi:hypothetical protein